MIAIRAALMKRQEVTRMLVRFAEHKELERINELRRQVFDLHAKGRPDIFCSVFTEELQNYLHDIDRDPCKRIVVAEHEGAVCAFAVVNRVSRQKTPYMRERAYLEIDELCVDEASREKGIATQMIAFIRDYAKSEGFDRIELNAWEFNRKALAFYESAGFSTYRRYMELKL